MEEDHKGEGWLYAVFMCDQVYNLRQVSATFIWKQHDLDRHHQLDLLCFDCQVVSYYSHHKIVFSEWKTWTYAIYKICQEPPLPRKVYHNKFKIVISTDYLNLFMHSEHASAVCSLAESDR